MKAIVLGLGGRTGSAHHSGNYRPQPWTYYGAGMGADDEAPATPEAPAATDPEARKMDKTWWTLAAFLGFLRVRRSPRR